MGHGIRPDTWIRDMAVNHDMIEPFTDRLVSSITDWIPGNGVLCKHPRKVISYGLSSFGYDMQLANEFKIFTNLQAGIIDPKDFDSKFLYDFQGGVCIVPPNSFALARSVEYFRIPRDVLTICLGKSTYARCGIVLNFTAFEPEWEGNVTIEISNTTPLPVKVYAHEGIAQVVFFQSEDPCEVSYADRHGKYQSQTGVTLAKV